MSEWKNRPKKTIEHLPGGAFVYGMCPTSEDYERFLEAFGVEYEAQQKRLEEAKQLAKQIVEIAERERTRTFTVEDNVILLFTLLEAVQAL